LDSPRQSVSITSWKGLGVKNLVSMWQNQLVHLFCLLTWLLSECQGSAAYLRVLMDFKRSESLVGKILH